MKLIYHPVSPYSRIVYMAALERGLADRIQLQKVVVCPLANYPGWSDDNDFVGGLNPVGKIPVLILDNDHTHDSSQPDSTALFDSRVICDYFDSLSSSTSRTILSPQDPRTWIDRTLQTTALSILDAEVLCVYEDKIRVENDVFLADWKEGQRIKVHRCLDFLDRAVRKGDLVVSAAARFHEANGGTADRGETGGSDTGDEEGNVTTAEICTASALAFLDMRGVEWRVGIDGKRNREALEKYWDTKWKDRKSLKWTQGENDWKTGRKAGQEEGGFKAF